MISERRQILPKCEVRMCFLIWISALIYASYHVYAAGKLFDMSKNGDDFNNGWFLGYKKDTADFEWYNWIPMIRLLMPWYLLHIILTEFTRWILIEALPVCYIMVTNLILFHLFGLKIVLLVFLKILLHFLTLCTRSILLVWILNTSFLLFLSFVLTYIMDYMRVKVSGSDYYFVVVTFAWLQLKCASFSFEFLKKSSKKLNFRILLSLLGYSYYLPLYFLGPLMLYNEYEIGVKQPFKRWTVKRLFSALLNILRYIMWIVLLDLFLHFFYIHALEYNLVKVKMLGVWHLNGLGYLLAAFFCVKYIAVYGLMRTLAAIESHNPPPAPSCVFYVYRNSQMWRTFDVGYYKFIKRYIYVPLLNESKTVSRRLIAAAITFSYVYIWHGTHANIFWWSLLNFIEVSIVEAALSEIYKNDRFQYWLHHTFNEANVERLTALIFAPLYLFFIFANSFFYVMDGGFIFISQFLEASWRFNVCSIFISYCFCITAMNIRNCQKKKINFENIKVI
ncbi:protein-cysteine N-palmitoyltransferase Rasp [Lycorma delicatula]|uniref:protein-cysteine N-palmitoyltransferase Rasp n=1 Tax=Lycorma delicatula TaxID=130591 RepID=UPI003F517520